MVLNRKLCVEGGLVAAAWYYTPSLILISTLLSPWCWGVHCKELRWKSGCADELLFFDCGNDSIIAVHEASFSSDVTHSENASCSVSDDDDDDSEPQLKINDTCQEDIRIPINRRCSGLRSCNFSYSHHTGRKCSSETGILTVQYDCVKELALYRYCNDKIRAKEGYISSPGYPMYYPLLEKCEWEIQAGAGQTVVLRLLDIHMRPPRLLDDRQQCKDAVTVLEGTTRRLMACGEKAETLQTLEAEADSGIVVQFKTEDLNPASGFLLYFKVRGCTTLQAPQDGYLVYRNGSSATYVCCQRYYFNDTQETSRNLQCIGDHHWNDTLPPCVAIEELKQINVTDSLLLNADDNATTTEPNPSVLSSKASYVEDILVPSILMATLLLGNALIVAIILRIRKKQKSKLELEDDDLSPQGSVPEATNV